MKPGWFGGEVKLKDSKIHAMNILGKKNVRGS